MGREFVSDLSKQNKKKKHLKFLDTFLPDLELLRPVREAPDLRLHPEAVDWECIFRLVL
jgi:hypothetical protein